MSEGAGPSSGPTGPQQQPPAPAAPQQQQLPVLTSAPRTYVPNYMDTVRNSINGVLQRQAQLSADVAGLNTTVVVLRTQLAAEAKEAAAARRVTDDRSAHMEGLVAALDFSGLQKTVEDLSSKVESGVTAAPVGPTDKSGVQDQLSTDDKISAAIRKYGGPWLCSVQPHWPSHVICHSETFGLWAAHVQSLNAGIPGLSDGRAAPTTSSASLPAAAVSGALPDPPLPDSSAPLPSSSVSLPFAAAMAGKRFKVDLPKPRYFNRLGVDSDVHLWLVRVQEYVTLAGFDVSIWAVIASQFFDKVPLQLWEARKARLVAENSPQLYSWDSFRAWWITTFAVHDRERHALNSLMSLRQTGTVAEYKAAHDVLAAQTDLPVIQRLIYWERGLKPEIRDECKFDLVTHTTYKDIASAQSAAIAIDSHLTAAAGKKRQGAPLSAAAALRPTSKAKSSHSATVQWRLDDGKFLCPAHGTMAEPLPPFFEAFKAECSPNQSGTGKLLPRRLLKSTLVKGVCFAKGCDEPHQWNQCAYLAHKVFNEKVAKA